ncbi:FUSC family protein [Micromonospora sp. NPDC007271]|uniref:FUSC family protein n=1 Tax=Micromonospora sp. NPDC007271 TaxID=3154587 RepID=UPI0033E15832
MRTRRCRALMSLADSERSTPRAAIRAAVVLPGLFAVGQYLVGDQSFATFTVFGGFALLIMSDFGGTRPERTRSYLLATAAGAVLVALGTLVSRSAFAVPAVMFLVAFVSTFLAAVVGGHVSTARLGLLLSFVLAVTLPPAAGQIPMRVAGWLVAGLAATSASLLLPRAGPVALARAAGAACRATGDLIDAVARNPDDPGLSRWREAVAQAVDAARDRYAGTASRAIGSRRRLRAYAELIGDLQLIVGVAGHPLYRPEHLARRGTGTEGELVAAVSGVLRSSAAALEGAAEGPDVGAVDRRQQAHRRALEQWVRRTLGRPAPEEQILDALNVDHTLRVLAYLSTAVAANASVAAGRDTAVRNRGATRDVLSDHPARHRRLRWLASSAAPGSTALRDSLRTGCGLALSVWLAGRLGLPHAFWVVLGTLQVLRTNALGTARSVARAVAGNVVGVAAGSALVIAAAGRPVWLWAALPAAVLLSAYTSGSQRFLLSQAAFTVDLMIIFNLLAPVGWRLGLIRLADVGVGVFLSVALSLLMWPHGTRRQFIRSAAAYHRAAAGRLRHAFDRMLAVSGAERLPAPAPLTGARTRAELALGAYLAERPAGPLDSSAAVDVLAGANYLAMAANLMERAATEFGHRADGCRDVAEPVRSAQQALLAGLARMADRLTGTGHPSCWPALPDLDGPVRTCLHRWRGDETVAGSATALVVAAGWIRSIDQVGEDLAGPVDRAATVASRPWWR